MACNFKKIESKWQGKWEKKKVFVVGESKSKKKFYVLEMFPYPSASGLHMGHALNYTIGDVYARFKRMKGFNVLYPMGFDALGLPAENAAIKSGEHPKPFTENAIKNYTRQMKEIGLSYDWSRAVSTMEPEYYKWNQYFFLKFLENDLVYKKKAPVNWCPKCQTVLANEQVHNGKCEYHADTQVEVKFLEQWFIKTTKYADELLEDLKNLKWPERVKTMQRNWIGKSSGTEIDFEIETPTEISNVVIVHGCPSNKEKAMNLETRTYDKHWIPWLREELEKKGLKIFTPLMPEPWEPEYEDWKKEFERLPINKNSILVGHSCGCAFLVRWLGETKQKIKKLILVAPWKIAESRNAKKGFYDYKIDKEIEHRVDEIIIFTSNDEEEGGRKSAKIFHDAWGVELIELKNHGHFVLGDMGTEEFPELLEKISSNKKWPIFTTRPDTIYGVTFMVISAQHPRLMEIVTDKQKRDIEKFLKRLKSVSEKEMENLEKEGVFTGSYAINPVTGEEVPVYVGNFVLQDYGSGMVMAVPAHDQRDFEFAKKYKLKIKQVISGGNVKTESYIGNGKLINSGNFDGMENREAMAEITKYLESRKIGKKTIQYKLKDWLISRQRYWGTPIPVVYCESCKKSIEKNSFTLNFYDEESFENLKKGIKTVETRASNPDEKNKLFYVKVKKGDYLKCVNKKNNEFFYLEILSSKFYNTLNELFKEKSSFKKIFPNKKIELISDLEDCYKFTEDYLDRIKKNGLVFWEVKKIIPGIVAVDEKDLPVELPTNVKFGKGNPLETNKKFVNVECPKCKSEARRETDTMDTFFDSSWYFLRYCDNKNKKKAFDEKKVSYWMPVDQYIGGVEHACMHLIYARFFTKALRDLKLLGKKIDEPFTNLFNQGMLLGPDGEKMSKSKGNVINPDEVSRRYGMDTARFFLLSLASPDKQRDWNEKGIGGALKFMKKIMNYAENFKIGKSSLRIQSKINEAIKQVSEDIEDFRYNFAIIKIRSLFDAFSDEGEVSKKDFKSFLKILHPFCPHVTEELWEKIHGNTIAEFLSLENWPVADEKKISKVFESQEKAIDSLIRDIFQIVKLVKKAKKVFVYVVPSEIEIYRSGLELVQKKTNLDVEIFAINDKSKYDPKDKAKKAKPGKPGIYIE